MSTTWTIELPVHFQRCGRGSRKELVPARRWRLGRRVACRGWRG
jgi:hypothetical protein